MTQVRYNVEREQFDDLVDRIGDLRTGLMPRLTERLEQHFDEVFSTRGAAAGTAWRPPSAVTLEIDRKMNRNPAVMEQTRGIGRIRRSLTQSRAPYALRRATSEKVTVGTKVAIAGHLERNRSFRGHNANRPVQVPGRRIVGVTSRLTGDLQKIVDAYLDGDSI